MSIESFLGGDLFAKAGDEIRFKLDRLVARRAISHAVAETAHLRAWEEGPDHLNHLCGELVFELSMAIPYADGEPLFVPTTWWDAFKARWSPRFLWHRCAWARPQYTRHDARQYFPNLPHVPQGFGPSFSLFVSRQAELRP